MVWCRVVKDARYTIEVHVFSGVPHFQILTPSQLETLLRINLLEASVGKASIGKRIFGALNGLRSLQKTDLAAKEMASHRMNISHGLGVQPESFKKKNGAFPTILGHVAPPFSEIISGEECYLSTVARARGSGEGGHHRPRSGSAHPSHCAPNVKVATEDFQIGLSRSLHIPKSTCAATVVLRTHHKHEPSPKQLRHAFFNHLSTASTKLTFARPRPLLQKLASFQPSQLLQPFATATPLCFATERALSHETDRR